MQSICLKHYGSGGTISIQINKDYSVWSKFSLALKSTWTKVSEFGYVIKDIMVF